MTNPDNICPCCGASLAFVNVQTYDAKYKLKPRITVECTNLECNLFGTTGTINDLREHHKNNIVIYRRGDSS